MARSWSVLGFGRRIGAPLVVAAALAAGAVGAGSTTSAQESDEEPASSCVQWDISGTWHLQQPGGYTPTVTFEQTETELEGVMTLPEGQWQAAGWKNPSNPLTGELQGDELEFLVTSPHADGLQSRGQYRGTVTEDGVTDGRAKDLAVDRPEITWTGTGPTDCVKFGEGCPKTEDDAEQGQSLGKDPIQLIQSTTPTPACRYVALGDSFSSGEGVPPFSSSNSCHRSTAAYSQLIIKSGLPHIPTKVDFWACSGSRSDDFYKPNHDTNEPPQLDRLGDDVGLVTLTIGGNDVGFADILSWCLYVDPGRVFGGNPTFVRNCRHKVDDERAPRVQGLETGNVGQDIGRAGDSTAYSLPSLFREIKAKAPNALVYAILAPSIFPKAPTDDGSFPEPNYACTRHADFEDGSDAYAGFPYASTPLSWQMSAPDLAYLHQFTAAVDFMAASAALSTGARVVNLIDLFQPEGGGARHDICSAEPWVHGLVVQKSPPNPPLSPFSFHPNAAGQKAMAAVIGKAIAGGPPLICEPKQTTQASLDVLPGQDTLAASAAWPGSSVVMSLVSPSGVVFDRSTRSSAVVHTLSPTAESFAISDPEPGRWTVRLYGEDVAAGGEPVSLSTTQIPSTAFAPLAGIRASADRGVAPSVIQFDASKSMAFGGAKIVAQEWDFGDGSPVSTGSAVSHTYAAGDHVATLTVRDSEGRTAVARQQVSIAGTAQPPKAEFVWWASKGPAGGTAPLEFDAGHSRGVVARLTAYSWDFGDGATADGEFATHTYARPGSYTVALRVVDDLGQEASAQQVVTSVEAASADDGGDDGGDGKDVGFVERTGAFRILAAGLALLLLLGLVLLLRRRGRRRAQPGPTSGTAGEGR
jgi:PKD repeat protein